MSEPKNTPAAQPFHHTFADVLPRLRAPRAPQHIKQHEGISTGNASTKTGIKKAEHDALKRAARTMPAQPRAQSASDLATSKQLALINRLCREQGIRAKKAGQKSPAPSMFRSTFPTFPTEAVQFLKAYFAEVAKRHGSGGFAQLKRVHPDVQSLVKEFYDQAGTSQNVTRASDGTSSAGTGTEGQVRAPAEMPGGRGDGVRSGTETGREEGGRSGAGRTPEAEDGVG